MIVICIESSHKRGMGHFFRALNIIDFLSSKKEKALIVINKDIVSNQLLEQKKIPYVVVDYDDEQSNWEKGIILKYCVDVWLLDKFYSSMELARHIKTERILLAAIDDCGPGAELVDIHFCSMIFQNLKGKKIFRGKDYLILNKEIEKYRRKRSKINKIIVSLGGSDTYGVTNKIVRVLKEYGYSADIVIGPNFHHKKQIKKEIDSEFTIIEKVPSLIELFLNYDMAITGGGVTCFEANASGLPCIIVANELHEIEIAKYVEKFGGSIFAGYYKEIDKRKFQMEFLNIEQMSIDALNAFPLNGMSNVYEIINERRRIENG